MAKVPHYPVAFYNIGPFGEHGRHEQVLEKEVEAIASTGAKIIGLCETSGWGDLPDLADYHKVRSRKSGGRANVAAWVHESLNFNPGQDVRWHQMQTEWKRWHHPGMHWARAICELSINKGQWFIAHQPPLGIKDIHGNWVTEEAQQESINLLARRMQPENRKGWHDRTQASQKKSLERLRVVLWDPNRSPDAPPAVPGPHQLAARIGGKTAGTAIEGGVVRGGHFVNARKQAQVNGVLMGSDHHGAFLATVIDD